MNKTSERSIGPLETRLLVTRNAPYRRGEKKKKEYKIGKKQTQERENVDLVWFQILIIKHPTL